MSFIPQTVIEEVINRTDIVQLLQGYLPLKKTGRNYSCCCPFHDEKTPSFNVSPTKQFYYCFGCGKHGNAIGFLMEHERMGFVQAIEKLATQTGLAGTLETLKQDQQRQNLAKPRVKPEQKDKLDQALKIAQTFYLASLKDPKVAKQATRYLKRRNITESSMHTFGIGFAPPGWDRLHKALRTANISRQDAIDAGLISTHEEKQRDYARFRDRIMFPIHNPQGKLIAFGGRVLGDEKPKYLNSPETPLFSKQQALYGLHQALQNKGSLKEFIVVEGYFDVVRLHQHGLTHSVATLGTSTSQSHLRILFRYCDRIVFCFDADAAGRKAAWRALETALPLISEHKHCAFLFLPENQDPDSFLDQQGKAAFLAELNRAQPMDEFLFSHVAQQLDAQGLPEGLDRTARLVGDALKVINHTQSAVVKTLLQAKLSEETGLNKAELEHIGQQTQPYDSPKPANPTAPQSQSRRRVKGYKRGSSRFQAPVMIGSAPPSLVTNLIRLLMSDQTLAKPGLNAETKQLDLPNMQLFIELYELLSQENSPSIAYLIGLWHDSPKGDTISELAAKEFLLEEDAVKLEFEDALKQLDLLAVDHELDKLINTPEPDKQKITQLLAQKRASQLASS